QWAVQGPIMIPAAIDIGASTAKTTMAVAWGDAWTNMVQPFWALPLLAIAGLKVRDIIGFCAIILIYSFFPIAIGLLFFYVMEFVIESSFMFLYVVIVGKALVRTRSYQGFFG